MGNPLYIHNPLYKYISSRSEKSVKKLNDDDIKKIMENTKEKNYKNAIIALCGMVVMVCIIGLYYYSKCNTAEKKIQELEKKLETKTSQPSGDYNTQPPCAGC